jgi:hypothetical protein
VKLRGALLGAGNIALRGHAPQWSGDPFLSREVEIVAVADLSAAEVFPQARPYAHADELLANETLDFCDVCAPPFTHRPLVEGAVARGVHVLCEKPIAPTLADAEAIAQAVRTAGVVFVPCHQYHHSPQWQAVARLLPRIGRIHLVEYEVHRTAANPGNPNCRGAAGERDGAAAGQDGATHALGDTRGRARPDRSLPGHDRGLRDVDRRPRARGRARARGVARPPDGPAPGHHPRLDPPRPPRGRFRAVHGRGAPALPPRPPGLAAFGNLGRAGGVRGGGGLRPRAAGRTSRASPCPCP